MNSHSIRFRLTAWYFAILGVGLTAVGIGAWFGMKASLYDAVDDGLRDRVQGVQKFMNEQISALSVREIRDEFREHSVLGPGGDLFQVCDDHGVWLYRSIPLENNQVPIRRPSQLGSGPLYETSSIQSIPVRLASQRIVVNQMPYSVEVAAPMDDFNASLERFRSLMTFSLPILLLLAIGGGYWLSRRALRPVDEITRTANSISIDSLSDRLVVPKTGDELQRLSETLNGMLARIENSVVRITQFTADASHELRTPLSLIRTTAEVALRRNRDPEEYREALGQVLAESEQTTKLVDGLLFLARADSRTDSLQLAPVNVVDTLREAVAQGQKLASEKGVSVESDLPRAAIEVSADSQALRGLFLILIDNAVKYTPSGGTVSVALRAVDGLVTATVKDSGIGIAEQDLPHIFDRFWRADKARSRETGGVGLGLSIARRIAERHGGEISVTSQPGRGATFCVRLQARGNGIPS
jgi:heavy metal sensor kinase